MVSFPTPCDYRASERNTLQRVDTLATALVTGIQAFEIAEE
jgi:hypothetical protein